MAGVAGMRLKLKKLKLAIGKARASNGDAKPEDRRKKPSEGNSKGQRNKYKTDGTVLYETQNDGKRNSRSRAKDLLFREGRKREGDVRRHFGPASSDLKRKRIYADQDVGDEGILHNEEVPNRKFLSKKGDYLRKDGFIKEKRSTKGMSREVGLSNGKISSTRERNFSKNEFIDGKSSMKALRSSRVYNGRDNATLDGKESSRSIKSRMRSAEVYDAKLKTEGKSVNRQLSAKMDGGEDNSQKKHVKSRIDSTKNADHWQNRRQTLEKTTKKIRHDKKDFVDDSVATDRPTKKIKRVIRIDPHDISNKRLDDGISVDDGTVEKEVDVEKDNELSKNAQFRAIQPSPSILSFVEDNLLGRRRLIELRRSGYNIKLSAPLDNIPFSTSSERERIEETVFRNKLTFFAAAKVSSSFPLADLPEVAFAGRSNVGKSSLLNALTRQWGVVRTSDKPGLTQTINFFNLGSKLCLVDLPGYGFAYAKEEVKDAWEELVKEYASTRVGLKRVCLLIDTKWGMKPRDHELINLMERSQTKYQIILTKTDVVFPIDVARRAMQIEESLKANKSVVQPVMMVSSKTGAGIRSLRTVLSKITRFVKM